MSYVDRSDYVLLIQSINPHVCNLDVNIAIILIELLYFLNIAVELLIVQAACSGKKSENVLFFRLHFLAESVRRNRGIPNESDPSDDRSPTFTDCKGHAGGSPLFIDVDLVLNIGVRVTAFLIELDDL